MFASNHLIGFGARTSAAGGNDANTIILAHFDGTNGSTTITDSSVSAHVGSATGTGALSTTQTKFGTASYKVVGAGAAGSSTGYAKFAQAASEFTFAADFCIDGWVHFIALNGTSSPSDMIWTNRNNSSSDLMAYLDGSGHWTLGNASGTSPIITAATGPSISTWYHVAAERFGSTITLYVGGVSVGSASNSSTFTGGDFAIGGSQVNSGARYMNGYEDEFRVSNVARFKGAFTPPSVPYS